MDKEKEQLRQELALLRAKVAELEKSQKQADSLIQNTWQKYSNILESITDAFFALDNQWRFIFVNSQAESLLFKSRQDLLGRSVWDEFPEAVGSTFYREYHRALAEQTSVAFKEFYPPLNTWFEVHAYPSPEGLAVYFQNVNERVKIETELKESELRFKVLSEATFEGLVIQDEGVVIEANERMAEMLGYTLDEFIGKSTLELIAPESRELILRHIAEDYKGSYEAFLLKKDGSSLLVEGRGKLLNYKGRTMRASTIRDISEREKLLAREEAALQQFRATASRYQRLIEANVIGVVTADFEGHILESNLAFLGMLGYSEEDLKAGRIRWDNMTPPEYAELDRRAWNDIITLGACVPFEKEFWRVDGSRVPVLIGAALLEGLQNTAISYVVDLTRQKQTEKALRESQEQWRILTESIPQLVWSTGSDGGVDYYSPRWVDYSGLNLEQLKDWNWQQLVHPDDLAQCLERWNYALQTGETYEVEYRLRRFDGQYFWFLGRALPIKDETGQIIRWFGTCTNINDQRQALETQKELDYLKDLFVSVAGHELRSPLTSLKGYAQFLQISLQKQVTETPVFGRTQDSILRSAQQIVWQADRMDGLINQLLDFSRIQNSNFELNYTEGANLVELVGRVVEQQRLARPTHHLLFRPPAQDIFLKFDANRLEQVLDNLISNAVKYSPAETNITIGIDLAPANNEVIIWVQDEGFGISEEHQAHIFDRFYRERNVATRSVDGLGLGLYVSNEIIRQHGGRMWLTSQPGQGSTFYFSLPLS